MLVENEIKNKSDVCMISGILYIYTEAWRGVLTMVGKVNRIKKLKIYLKKEKKMSKFPSDGSTERVIQKML